jgi:hypothetical protein
VEENCAAGLGGAGVERAISFYLCAQEFCHPPCRFSRVTVACSFIAADLLPQTNAPNSFGLVRSPNNPPPSLFKAGQFRKYARVGLDHYCKIPISLVDPPTGVLSVNADFVDNRRLRWDSRIRCCQHDFDSLGCRFSLLLVVFASRHLPMVFAALKPASLRVNTRLGLPGGPSIGT